MSFSIGSTFSLSAFLAACLVGIPPVKLQGGGIPPADGYLVCQNGILTVYLNEPENADQIATVVAAAAAQGVTPNP